MCVIILCEREFPSVDTLKSAEAMNGHGGGIAWVDKTGKVMYRKALGADEIQHIIETEAQLPAIVHFRIASIGHVSDELCHPFPITDDSEVSLSGECDSVLFHNGTWSEWDTHLLSAITSGKLPMPKDTKHMSDSRCMALLANTYGKNILNLIAGKSDKIAVLSINGIEKFGEGWVTHKSNTCSNDYFVKRETVFTYDPMSKAYSYTIANNDNTQHHNKKKKKKGKNKTFQDYSWKDWEYSLNNGKDNDVDKDMAISNAYDEYCSMYDKMYEGGQQ